MKRITLCALLMTLFLLISCNTSGKNLKEDEVAKSDGTVIDLVKITKHITDTVAFAKDVKEVHSLVKSIDELANAIGKKIQANGLAADASHNGRLVVGAYNIVLTVDTKLKALGEKPEISDDLKAKVGSAKKQSEAFLAKVKSDHANLGKEDVDDATAKKVMDLNDATKDKGAEELVKLNTAIDNLLKDADAAVTSAIKELTTPAKP
ncbi:Vsp/OspC family lipoprotein (plasmid) [Borrelia puertoricensis]|uniref:Vsp/OspC family lipoprotein n=1 Tax=Borrelia puertoricensis TaxID=2756107 RepID=UPI003EBB3FE4